MPAGKIDEIAPEGSGIYKIRTDYDDFTLYEVQNRSSGRVEAVFRFHVVQNIRFELCSPHGRLGAVEGKRVVNKQGKDAEVLACYTASVGPGETVKVIKLMTAQDGKPWSFDYELTAEAEDEGAPSWLAD